MFHLVDKKSPLPSYPPWIVVHPITPEEQMKQDEVVSLAVQQAAALQQQQAEDVQMAAAQAASLLMHQQERANEACQQLLAELEPAVPALSKPLSPRLKWRTAAMSARSAPPRPCQAPSRLPKLKATPCKSIPCFFPSLKTNCAPSPVFSSLSRTAHPIKAIPPMQHHHSNGYLHFRSDSVALAIAEHHIPALRRAFAATWHLLEVDRTSFLNALPTVSVQMALLCQDEHYDNTPRHGYCTIQVIDHLRHGRANGPITNPQCRARLLLTVTSLQTSVRTKSLPVQLDTYLEGYRSQLHRDLGTTLPYCHWMPQDLMTSLCAAADSPYPIQVWAEDQAISPFPHGWMMPMTLNDGNRLSHGPAQVGLSSLLTLYTAREAHVGYARQHHFRVTYAPSLITNELSEIIIRLASYLRAMDQQIPTSVQPCISATYGPLEVTIPDHLIPALCRATQNIPIPSATAKDSSSGPFLYQAVEQALLNEHLIRVTTTLQVTSEPSVTSIALSGLASLTCVRLQEVPDASIPHTIDYLRSRTANETDLTSLDASALAFTSGSAPPPSSWPTPTMMRH